MNPYNQMNRLDGSMKSQTGFLGQMSDLRNLVANPPAVMTEFSIGAPGTNEKFRPSLVPTLTADEIMQARLGIITPEIQRKSLEHALMRERLGRSVFFEDSEIPELQGADEFIRTGITPDRFNPLVTGTITPLPDTRQMKLGRLLQNYLAIGRNLFPEGNPYGQAIENFLFGEAEKMARSMVEGDPNAVIDTRANQQVVNPAFLETLGIVPIGTTASVVAKTAPAGAALVAGRAATKGIEDVLDLPQQADSSDVMSALAQMRVASDPASNVMEVSLAERLIPEIPNVQLSAEALPSTGLLSGRIIKRQPLEIQYQYEKEVQDIIGTAPEDFLGLQKIEDVTAPSKYEGHQGASNQILYRAETEVDDLGRTRLTSAFKDKLLQVAAARGHLMDQDAVTLNYAVPINNLEDANLAFIDLKRPVTDDEMTFFDQTLMDLGGDDGKIARVSHPSGIKFLNVGMDNQEFQNILTRLDDMVENDIKLGLNDVADDIMYGYVGSGDLKGGKEIRAGIGAKIDDASGRGLREPWWSTVPRFVQIKEQIESHRAEFLKNNPLPQRTIREIGEENDALYKLEKNTLAIDDYSQNAEDQISGRMFEEVMQVLRGGDRSGLGWYTDEYDQALSDIATRMPELQDSKQKDIFTTLVSIFSDGTELGKNTELAITQYNDFLKTGKVNALTPVGGGERTSSYINNLNRLQKLFDEKGIDETIDFLNGTSTARELEKISGKSIGYLADTVLPNTMVFGDKMGAFMANLKGNPDYLTMDRWWNRTFNRLRGQMTVQPTTESIQRFKEIIGRPNAQMRTVIKEAEKLQKQYAKRRFKDGTEAEKTANTIMKSLQGLRDRPQNKNERKFQTDVAKKVVERLKKETEYKNMNVADLQAIMWFAEKRRMREFGSRSPIAEKTYADVTRDQRDKIFSGLPQDAD